MNWTDKITVTNEDNMELMARYPDKYFDLAIVDPFYGIEMSNIKTIGFGRKGTKPFNIYNPKKWDNKIPSKEYFKELFRLSKNQIIWGANYFTQYLPNSRGWCFWDKQYGEGVNFSHAELAFTSFDMSVQKFICKVSESRNTVSNNKQLALSNSKIHPTQKPIKLYKWLLDKYANQGDKILDTHLGSGSIAIACHDYGFELTACELDKEYYDASYKRFKNHISQQRIEF
jgi:site-specific DNA-methyltransferase (adenine-specific)